MSRQLEARIADRALAYLLDPPGGDAPVIDFRSPDELLAAFGSTVGLPLDDRSPAMDPDRVLEAVDQIIRYSVKTSHPRFLNQNFAGPDPVSVVGDWLGAALNTTGATFEAAPVFTLMESAVLHKLARRAGYIEHASGPGDAAGGSTGGAGEGAVPTLPPGLFCPGGSTATLYALQLARHRHQPDVVTAGANGDRLVVFVSAAGHYSTTKSAALLGLGTGAVVEVDSDDDGAIIPAALERAVAEAIAGNRVPLAVVATSGTTVTAAFDDLNALAEICDRHRIWLHVDGCYGGSALFSPDHAHLLSGVERSDSMVWNLHKMMGMTQQCTALLVKEPEQLAPCFATSADYLFQPDKQYAHFDSGDRTFQCARRIDVLKLWLTWKVRGDQGFADRIDHAVAMADHARSVIAGSGGAFTPVVGGRFTNVVFAWVPPELRPVTPGRDGIAALSTEDRHRLHGLPPKIKARMQREGSAMLGFQPVHGINTFRLIFMNPAVTTTDVDAVLTTIDEYGTDITRGDS